MPPLDSAAAVYMSKHRLRYLAIACTVIGYGFVFARQPLESDWYRVFVRAACRMQRGEPIHIVDATPYAYPPLMAMLTIPLAQLPPSLGIVAWYLVSLSAMAAAFWYAWRLSGGPPLGRWNRRWAVVAGMALLCSMRFLVGCLETRQFDAVIAALLLSGCWRLAQGKQASTGLLWGLAAGMKCTPLLLAPYLAWRGWYRAAVLVGLTAVAANLAPEFLFPQRSGDWYLAQWKHRFLDVAQKVPPGTWFSGLAQNQSLAGAAQRLARYGLPMSMQAVRAGELSPGIVPLLRGCVYASSALLVAASVYFAGRRRGSKQGQPDVRKLALEVSAVFALMLLLSPMTSRAHYIILLLPAMLICRAAFVEGAASCRRLLPALLACGPLATKGLVGKALGDLALAWSLPTWYAILCLAGMWWLMAGRPGGQSSHGPQSVGFEGAARFRRRPAAVQSS